MRLPATSAQLNPAPMAIHPGVGFSRSEALIQGRFSHRRRHSLAGSAGIWFEGGIHPCLLYACRGSDAWKAYMRRQTNTINWSKEQSASVERPGPAIPC